MQRIPSRPCQHVPSLGVVLNTKQNFQELQLYPLHASRDSFCTQNAPDITAVAQYGFHKAYQTPQDRVVNIQVLTSSLHSKHESFGSLAGVLNGRAQSPGPMHQGPNATPYSRSYSYHTLTMSWSARSPQKMMQMHAWMTPSQTRVVASLSPLQLASHQWMYRLTSSRCLLPKVALPEGGAARSFSAPKSFLPDPFSISVQSMGPRGVGTADASYVSR